MTLIKRGALFATVCITLALVTGAISARASDITLTGNVWSYVSGTTDAGNAVLASVPTRAPDVTFTVTGAGLSTIDLTGSLPSSYTLSDFLNSNTGTAVVSNIAGSAAVLSSNLGPLTNNGPASMGDIFTLTGTASLMSGETFTVTHDDGVSFYVNGALLNTTTADPTSSVGEMAIYTGPDLASANFEVVYGECCDSPADLKTNLPAASTVPEPSTFLLVLPGIALLLGLGLTRRFHFQG